MRNLGRLIHGSFGSPERAIAVCRSCLPQGGGGLRRSFTLLSRLSVSSGLLWVLAERVDWANAQQTLRHFSLLPLAAAIAAWMTATVPVNAARWRVIFPAAGPAPGIFALMKLLMVGLFFNQILPTGVGGDAVRAWRCTRLGIGIGAAVRGVLLDRASGYLIMTVIYAAGLPFLFRNFPNLDERIALVSVLGIVFCSLPVLCLLGRSRALFTRWPALAVLRDLYREAALLIVNPIRCGAILGLSILMIGFTILGCVLAGNSVGISLSFATWLLIVPALSFIQLFPISIAGWGVREAGLVILLSGFGVSPERALATSMLIGLGLMVTALPGGLIWLFNWDISRPITVSRAGEPVGATPT